MRRVDNFLQVLGRVYYETLSLRTLAKAAHDMAERSRGETGSVFLVMRAMALPGALTLRRRAPQATEVV